MTLRISGALALDARVRKTGRCDPPPALGARWGPERAADGLETHLEAFSLLRGDDGRGISVKRESR